MAKLDKLIDYAYMKEEVDIPQNIPDTDLEKKIYKAQETLRMLMGDEFYQDYKSNYISGTITGAYLTLQTYLDQYVAHQAYEFYTIQANFAPTRSGFRVHTEENSVVASDVQMATIIKDAKERAQYYKRLLVDFLNGNSANYPLYDSYCNTSNTGNSFHITAVSKKHAHNCGCNKCRC